MNIGDLRVRITIQKNETQTDQYGNHKSYWTDYFRCWATAVSRKASVSEGETASHIAETEKLDFTVRYSTETALVNPKRFRVILNDRIYNIVSVDPMAFKHNSIKLHTELCER